MASAQAAGGGMTPDVSQDAARLPRLGPEDVPPRQRAVFEAFLKERGNIPNLFRIAAHAPAVHDALRGVLTGLMVDGAAPVRLKELVAVRVSHRNACDYCLASHRMLAQRYGATDAELDALARGDLAGFSPPERAALALADAMTAGNGHVADDDFAALAAHWPPPAAVELVAVAAAFNMFNRFANALEIPPTR
jgi:uncharacterized peroxidase-related enzyme